MKIWPLSVLKESPLMPSAYAWELSRFYTHPPTEGAFHACIAVAPQIQPVPAPGLVVIESVSAPNRLAYVEYPTRAEFERLERAFVAEADDGYRFIMMDSLH